MSNINLRNIINNFLDVRLASLKSWRRANEISPRDKGGPYVPRERVKLPKRSTKGAYDDQAALKHREFICRGILNHQPT